MDELMFATPVGGIVALVLISFSLLLFILSRIMDRRRKRLKLGELPTVNIADFSAKENRDLAARGGGHSDVEHYFSFSDRTVTLGDPNPDDLSSVFSPEHTDKIHLD